MELFQERGRRLSRRVLAPIDGAVPDRRHPADLDGARGRRLRDAGVPAAVSAGDAARRSDEEDGGVPDNLSAGAATAFERATSPRRHGAQLG